MDEGNIMAWIYDAMDAVKTQLEAISPAPDVVAIVPKGHEGRSVPAGKTFWCTLNPEGDEETPEPGAAYVVDYIIGVTVWIKSNAISATIVSALSTKIKAVRDKIRYNDLAGFGRMEILGDRFEGGEYIDGEDSESVYGYKFMITVPKQYTS
jgi:hypothetical protein